MKWSYLLPRLALAAIIWTFFAFAFDPLVRSGLVQLSRSATGTKVEIYDLQTGFFPPSIRTGPVAIASPAKDKSYLATFSEMELKLSGRPLLQRNLIVEEASLRGIEFNTPRTSDPDDPDSPHSDGDFHLNFDPFRKKSKQLGQAWLDVLKQSAAEQIDLQRLATVRVSLAVESEWKQRFAQYETRLDQVKQELDSVQTSVKTAEGKTLDKIKTYAESAERADRLVQEGKRIRNELNGLPQIAQRDFQRIEQAKEQDLKQLDELMDSVSPDPQKILHALIGDELSAQVEQVFGWSSMIFQTVKTMRDEPEPERMQGEWIDFRPEGALPNVLFKQIHLSGKARVNQQKYPFQALVREVSSAPTEYRKPIHLQARVDAEGEVRLAGDLKFYVAEPTHDFVVKFALPRQKTIQLEDSEKLSLALIADQTECESRISFREHDFVCRVEFRQTPVRFQFASDQTGIRPLSQVVSQALSSIDSISATLEGSGSYRQPVWRLKSETGAQIARGLKLACRAELGRQKQELAQQIEELAQKERERLVEKLNQQYSGVLADLEAEETRVQSVIQKVSGRPLNIRKLLR